jgi:hypothetical protein
MCKANCCRRIPIKRYFLPLVFLPFILFIDDTQTFTYIPLIVGGSAFSLFWNYPLIVYYTASKPLYYEDLFIDEKSLPNYDVNPKLKYKFQTILVWILIITNSILVGALGDYWYYKIVSGNYTALEILGVTGGIIKLFQIINNTISRIMLKILRRIIKKENIEMQRKKTNELKKIIQIKSIQMTDIESSKILHENKEIN